MKESIEDTIIKAVIWLTTILVGGFLLGVLIVLVHQFILLNYNLMNW